MSRNNPGATLPREALEPGLRQRLLMFLARLSGNRASPRALIKSVWFVPFFAVIAVLFVWPLIMLVVGAVSDRRLGRRGAGVPGSEPGVPPWRSR